MELEYLVAELKILIQSGDTEKKINNCVPCDSTGKPVIRRKLLFIKSMPVCC